MNAHVVIFVVHTQLKLDINTTVIREIAKNKKIFFYQT